MSAPRESLSLHVPADLKRQIEEYAEKNALVSLNAAACVLLAKGLRAARKDA